MRMKYIKTYEQLIPNYLKELESLKKKYLKSIKDSMQEVIDEYATKLELSILDPDRPGCDDDNYDHLYQFKVKIKMTDDVDSFLNILESSLYKLQLETESEIQKISVYLSPIKSDEFVWNQIFGTAKNFEELVPLVKKYKLFTQNKGLDSNLLITIDLK